MDMFIKCPLSNHTHSCYMKKTKLSLCQTGLESRITLYALDSVTKMKRGQASEPWDLENEPSVCMSALCWVPCQLNSISTMDSSMTRSQGDAERPLAVSTKGALTSYLGD